jgi:Histidine kinase-, DNA gyrase B-, and HSP90-like ATPase
MRTPVPRPGRPRWLRLPRRTARLRLTVLYGAAFLACGAAVLTLTYLLFGQAAHPVAHLSRGNPPTGSGTAGSKLTTAVEVDRLFQPFRRLGQRPARRNGHGLGLSIVHAIATAHGATIRARALPGGGLAIDVTFPPPPATGTRIR